MLPVIPLVAAAVSAAILIRNKKSRYLHGRMNHDLSRFARQYGVTVADDGSFDPNALVDGEPLLFSVLNKYHIASKLEYLEMLLAYGANPDICNSKGVPALIYALSCVGSYEIVSILLKHGANPNAMDADGRTAVFFIDSPSVLSELRDAGAELDAVDANGEPALFYWLTDVKTQICLDELLAYGVNPNICNSEGVPALIYALSMNDSKALVSILLKHGANPNAMDADGRTAVFFADSPSVLSELRDAGAELNALDANGKPALFYWLSNVKTQICLDELLAYGVNPDICNSEGVPALIYALSMNDNKALVSILLKHGANPNAMDADGRTAVFFADSSLILSELKKYGAKFDVVDAMGKPAFFHTLSIVRALYFVNAAGVDVNTTDSEGKNIAFYISGPHDFRLLLELEAKGLKVDTIDNSGQFFDYHSDYYQYFRQRSDASKRLYEAVNDNDISGAIRALEDGADLDTRDTAVHGWNMIFLAIYRDNPQMIKELARFGVDINHMHEMTCPLEKAIYDKNEACVEMLLSLGANPKPAMLTLQYSATPEIKKIFSRYGHTV